MALDAPQTAPGRSVGGWRQWGARRPRTTHAAASRVLRKVPACSENGRVTRSGPPRDGIRSPPPTLRCAACAHRAPAQLIYLNVYNVSVEPMTMIRTARYAAGITQVELAARAGTTQPAVAAYESGARRPNLATLSRLLEGCEHDVEVLARPRVRRGAASLAELSRTISEDLLGGSGERRAAAAVRVRRRLPGILAARAHRSDRRRAAADRRRAIRRRARGDRRVLRRRGRGSLRRHG